MKDEQLRTLSVIQLRQLIECKKEINLIGEKNSDIIWNVKSVEKDFDFFSNDSRFGFSVYNIVPKKENPTGDLACNIMVEPRSLEIVSKGHYNMKLIDVAKRFNKWISDIKTYEEALIEYYDPFYKQFEDEYEKEFSITSEEHDDTITLSSDNQLKVYRFLNDIEVNLKKEDESNPEIQRLLDYVKDFKEDLYKLPKSAIKKRAINLAIKLRKGGIKFFYDTLEIGYKEIIKFALHAGADGLQSVIHNLHSL